MPPTHASKVLLWNISNLAVREVLSFFSCLGQLKQLHQLHTLPKVVTSKTDLIDTHTHTHVNLLELGLGKKLNSFNAFLEKKLYSL